ncbi:MAG TPA: hypothetical protein VGD60_11450 [Candidatus Acidoferrales bacterium]
MESEIKVALSDRALHILGQPEITIQELMIRGVSTWSRILSGPLRHQDRAAIDDALAARRAARSVSQ